MRRCWILLLVIASCPTWNSRSLPLDSVALGQESAAPSVSKEAGEADSSEAKGPVPVLLTNALEAARTFLLAIENDEIDTATAAMDFSAVVPAPDAAEKALRARHLKAVIESLPLLDAEHISTDPQGPAFAFPDGKGDPTEVVVVRCSDGLWRFSAETVAKVEILYELLQKRGTSVESPPQSSEAEGSKADVSVPSKPEPAAVSTAPVGKVPDALRSARRVMRTLMDGLEDRQYELVVLALDFSELDPEMGPYARLGIARKLKDVIDRMEVIDYSQISDDPEGPPFDFPIDSTPQPIRIVRDEAGVWRFSAETVAQVENLHELYRDRPVVNLPESQKAWYDRELLLGNETWRIIALFVVIFASLLAGHVVRAAMRSWTRRLDERGRVMLSVVVQTIGKTAVPVLLLIALYAALQFLTIDFSVKEAVNTVIHVVFTLLIGYIFFRMVDVVVEFLRKLAVRSGSTLNDMLVPIVSTSLRLTVIFLVLLEILTAFSGQPPSSVIAGLGAGGLAIGLAAQDTIKNFFGSMMIYADRPFELGDRIVIDGHDGPVESVGFRSTRIRTLDGHLVTVPNGEMAYKTIHNIGKRPYIRRIMNIRLAYDTPPDKVRAALAILRELLADHEGMKEQFPPRVFLHDFLEAALNIRAIYWYHPPAYWDFCDFGERLNLEIVERFGAAGIRFALPSQRLFLESGQDQPKRD